MISTHYYTLNPIHCEGISVFALPVLEKPNGVILYRGPSVIDGSPIVVVLTGLRDSSENKKTGTLLQTWILVDGVSPVDAVESGADAAVCGDCRHRKHGGAGSCYVNVGQGPQSVYRALTAGRYPAVTTEQAAALVEGRTVRLGSYGDPAAVPISVWDTVLATVAGHTGYTHQWRHSWAKGLRRYCMASVETVAAARLARKRGWRTFRVTATVEQLGRGEIRCPASAEGGYRSSCVQCQSCDGSREGDGRVSVAIAVHGLDWKVARYRNLVRLMTSKKRLRTISEN